MSRDTHQRPYTFIIYQNCLYIRFVLKNGSSQSFCKEVLDLGVKLPIPVEQRSYVLLIIRVRCASSFIHNLYRHLHKSFWRLIRYKLIKGAYCFNGKYIVFNNRSFFIFFKSWILVFGSRNITFGHGIFLHDIKFKKRHFLVSPH